MRWLALSVFIPVLFLDSAGAVMIDLSDFGPPAVTEDYSSYPTSPDNPTPIVIGGNTYTTASGNLRWGPSFGDLAGGSGAGLSAGTSPDTMSIRLGTPVRKAGLYVGQSQYWSAAVSFYDEDDSFLGMVSRGSAAGGCFIGLQADSGLIARITINARADNGEGVCIDDFTTEELLPGAPVMPAIPAQWAKIGELFTYDVDAAGDPAPVYSLVSGPHGMTIDSVTGVISWTPSSEQTGSRSATVRATNSQGSDKGEFTIKLTTLDVAAPVLDPIPDQTATQDQPWSYHVTATGVPAPDYWLTDPPTGMTVDLLTGVISWIPHVVGPIPVTVRAHNAVGTDSLTFTLDVLPLMLTLMTSSSSGGTVTVPGEGSFTYPLGQHVAIEAVAEDDYRFLCWGGTAEIAHKIDSVESPSTTVAMQGDYTLVAYFESTTAARRSLWVSSTDGGYVRIPGEGAFTYSEGTEVPIHACRNGGYHFIGWTGTAVDAGKVLSPAATHTTVRVDDSYTLKANFEADSGILYTLTVHSTPGGTVTPAVGSYTRSDGAQVAISASADTGYHFVGWTGTAVDAGRVADPMSTSTTLTVKSDCTIIANFEPYAGETCTLTTSSTPGGWISNPGEGVFDYDEGTVVSLTAQASGGYAFLTWTGTAVDAGKVADATSAGTTVTMDADYTLVANFQPASTVSYTLAVSSNSGGHVSIPGEGAFDYAEGTVASLNAIADDGYAFAGWTGTAVDAGKVDVATSAGTTVTVDADYTLVANFTSLGPPAQHGLTLSASRGGCVSSPGEGVFQYEDGELVTLHAEPDPSYRFSHWSGNLWSTVNPTTVVVDGDCRIRANFVSALDVLYVDDDAPCDPCPCDSAAGDPEENGAAEHPFDTIQEAIDVAAEQARVIVRAGTYFERVDLLGKSIVLTSVESSDSTSTSYPVIDSNGVGTVVSFTSGEDASCVLEGFVITGGAGQRGGGVYCSGSSPTLINCLIVGNRTVNPGGGAVYCRASEASFVNCTVSGNYGGPGGAGFYGEDSTLLLTNSILWDNQPCEVRVEGTGDLEVADCDIAGGAVDLGIVDVDPLFTLPGYWADPVDPNLIVDPAQVEAIWIGGDYHLMSEAGHWDQDVLRWELDPGTSPCIDAGSADSDWADEPEPNGGRINLGAYGGTAQASKSPASP